MCDSSDSCCSSSSPRQTFPSEAQLHYLNMARKSKRKKKKSKEKQNKSKKKTAAQTRTFSVIMPRIYYFPCLLVIAGCLIRVNSCHWLEALSGRGNKSKQKHFQDQKKKQTKKTKQLSSAQKKVNRQILSLYIFS